MALTTVQLAMQGSPQYYSFKNRIINGAMVIDQRNAGASVTNLTTYIYSVDRFIFGGSQASKYTLQQNAGAITPPAGFTNYIGVTSSSAYSVGTGDYFSIQQRIEGYNIADLGWGTANAKTVTLSFWVRSSLTGTFGGAILNSATNRSYPFSYVISSANTWQQVSITIAGDTAGTWLTTNGIGIIVSFGLGYGSTYGNGTAGAWAANGYESVTGAVSVVGTNGATWYVTGVQLEVGSSATSFDYRPYGTELQLCQRYYQLGAIFSGSAAYAINTTYYHFGVTLGTAMRISPSVPTPTNCGTLAVTSGGQDGYRTPLVYPTTAASSSSLYGFAASAEL